jgi:hypothetical protein
VRPTEAPDIRIYSCAHVAPVSQDASFQSLTAQVTAVRTDVIAKLDGIAGAGASDPALRDKINVLEQRVKDLETIIKTLQANSH